MKKFTLVLVVTLSLVFISCKEDSAVAPSAEPDYKEYVARVTQIGSGAPFEVVIKNDFEVLPTYKYIDVGKYAVKVSCNARNTAVSLTNGIGKGYGFVQSSIDNDTTIYIYTFSSSIYFSDNVLGESSFIIREYQ